MNVLESPLDSLKGIGEKTKQLFENAGIENLGDLISYFPRAYEKYDSPCTAEEAEKVHEEETVSVYGTLKSPVDNRYIGGKCISNAICTGKNRELRLIWYNMPYLKNTLHTGIVYVFRGRLKKHAQNFQLEQPSVFTVEQYRFRMSSLQPVYSLTRGLTLKTVQKAVRQALETVDLQPEYLSESTRQRLNLCDYRSALTAMHFPKNEEELKAARRRLVFDEFFFFLLKIHLMKQQREKTVSPFKIRSENMAGRVIANLSYELTGAQKKVWEEIKCDLKSGKVMARLIQGDVGSGKTVLAVLALLTAAENGYQGAMMAPTEVLARQHYDYVVSVIRDNNLPYEAVLLSGSLTAKNKREICKKMESGEASIIIGTHALIQEKAVYRNLALVITDEQHRFGVRQREKLKEKGSMPHTIVMSATPIPRTLSEIMYGDLDISVLDEMPSKRLRVKNCVAGPQYRAGAYKLIREQIRLGHQAYVICPMVDESDVTDAENVTEYTEKLRRIMKDMQDADPEDKNADIVVACLHGRMKADEKNKIMERFLKNEIQILVSTTVVEVGVNVPNATVMMIENSERFGLAALHQLRGRVGRGSAQSYCIFMHTSQNEQVLKRLDILNHSNDGFRIAAMDLKLRGPGDILGVRQSGEMNFKLADIYSDSDILRLADGLVTEILNDDSELLSPEHSEIKKRYLASFDG